jgi:hypothetical protein
MIRLTSQPKGEDERKDMRIMHRQMMGLALCIAAFAMSAAAQITGSGTSGTVPVFTGPSTEGNSPISVSGGNVGIGTTAPGAAIEVDSPTIHQAIYNDTNSAAGGYSTYETNGVAFGFIGTGQQLFTGGSATDFGISAVGANNLTFGFSPYQRMTITSSGSVGIGTTTPAYPLDVAGQIHSSGGIVFPDGSVQTTATGQTLSANNAITQSNGNVGIGTTGPVFALDVNSGGNTYGDAIAYHGYSTHSGIYPVTALGGFDSYADDWTYVGLGATYGHSSGFTTQIPDPALLLNHNGTVGIYADSGQTVGSLYYPTARLLITPTGNVGIGTTAPGAKLEVSGNLKLTSGSGASITFQDGTVQSTAWTGTTCGGDYAESVDVSGDRTHYEPGDVLVIDPAAEGNFLKSVEPYSTSVTGIYSTKPGLVGRRQLTDKSQMKDEVPMAMVGIVPTKVSAENGPIKPGDMLVTSSTLGYAMNGTDRSRMLGAVIGKALGHLDSGTGVIEVVVTLQ